PFSAAPTAAPRKVFDDLVDINYSVTVTAPTTAAPEPGTLLLLASGLASLGLLMRRSISSNS
ncbi:MAG TPA: PEP-CTERM sorting domain-containing protein, partial [Candidatus Acidoferrum sp.]|nr:PEP-CTERM sorting domain-containing protein [Candidatus Acidoferrum sp.]